MRIIDELSGEEVALLLATRCSLNCQSRQKLTANVSQPVEQIAEPLQRLMQRGMLEEVACWDGIRYGFGEQEQAQAVYRELSGEEGS